MPEHLTCLRRKEEPRSRRASESSWTVWRFYLPSTWWNGPCVHVKNFPLSFQKPVLKQALIIALQQCFHPNFSVRLYALVALKKIWSMCKALHVEECDALTSVIESSLNQVENMPGTG